MLSSDAAPQSTQAIQSTTFVPCMISCRGKDLDVDLPILKNVIRDVQVMQIDDRYQEL